MACGVGDVTGGDAPVLPAGPGLVGTDADGLLPDPRAGPEGVGFLPVAGDDRFAEFVGEAGGGMVLVAGGDWVGPAGEIDG